MQVSVQNGEGLERRLTVGLEPDQIDAEVDKRLHEMARTARLRGFRPGKVPLKVLRRHYGAQVLHEIFGQLVNESLPEAVAEAEITPVGVPHIEPDIDQSAKRYSYTAVFEVLPKFELGTLEGETIKRPVAEVAEADLDAMLATLREQGKTWNPVARPAVSGDRLRVSFNGTMEGEPFEGGSAEDVEIELGRGRMIVGFEDGLVGVQNGEERRIELRFPDDYVVSHLRGRPVVFDVRVSEVAEPVLPELDAEFAKRYGVADGDIERFRADVRTSMERELKQRIDARVKNQALDLLLEANRIELPDVLVRNEIERLEKKARQSVPGGQLELPDGLFEDQARRHVALGLIVAEVVKVNGIQVDEARVRETVEDMASSYEQPQQVIEHYYGDKDRLAAMETLTLENQVVDWVLEQVTVIDEPTTFEAISKLAGGE